MHTRTTTTDPVTNLSNLRRSRWPSPATYCQNNCTVAKLNNKKKRKEMEEKKKKAQKEGIKQPQK